MRTETVYTTCKYAPEELLAGFGVKTERLDPNPASFSCADGCGHPNLCGFAKAVIEEVRARDIQALIVTDCCDAMRRTYDVLKSGAVGELPFLYFLPLPHKTGERELTLFVRELRRLGDAFGNWSGKDFDDEKAWEACLQRVRRQDGAEEEKGYVSVCGAHGGQMLLGQVQRSFEDVRVRDDTCSGNRWFPRSLLEEKPGTREAFFDIYARLLLTGLTPCMRMTGRAGEIPSGEGLRGVIYHTVKFCDYYSFSYAELKNTANTPLLKIETDTTPQSSGQLKTRIEAFREILEAGSHSMPRSGEITASATGGEMFGRRTKEKIRQTGKAEAVGKEATGKAADRQKCGSGRVVAGIDSGSTSTDVVLLDEAGSLLGSSILPTGMSASRSAAQALEAALEEAGLSRQAVSLVVATGYGRDALDMEKRTVTEITCHARGAHHLFPQARTIIDIGGQDSKVIRIDEKGNVQNFIMNDKCAAGTGRFLEMQARALGLSMEEMSRTGLTWKEEVQISNMCTVFAESEVVSLVAQDTAISDIVHGLNQSVAAKTVSLVQRGKGEPGYCMTGGVSRNQGVVSCLEKKLGETVSISDQSQLCGAIGAALLGLEMEK